MRTLFALVAACVFVFTLAAPAVAKSGFDDLLEEARELETAGRVKEAAARLGEAVATAHRKGDLLAELAAAKRLDGLFGGGGVSVGNVSAGSSGATSKDRRDLLAIVMGELDPARNGAFVSAPVLARRILYAATELGDTEHATEAADVLRAHAKTSGSGNAPGVLLRYADGLVVLDAAPTDAAPHFEAALAAATEEGWVDLAVRVGTELAGVRHASGDTEGAAKALSAVAEIVTGDVSAQTSSAWQRALRARIPDTPAELTKIVTDAIAALTPSGAEPVVSKGGYGKAKGTDFGRAFKRMSRKKPFVSVERIGDGHEVAVLFEPKGKEVKLHRSAQQRVERTGMTVVIAGHRVALHDVSIANKDATGLGQGARVMASNGGVGTIVRAEYLLARGETWFVTKSGLVTVK